MRQNKIFICFSIPLMLVLTNVHADYFSYEKKAIAQVKATPASKIDPNLPVLPYEQWVRNLAGKDAKIQWELNDCGEGTGGPADRDRDMPLCVGLPVFALIKAVSIDRQTVARRPAPAVRA